MVSGILNMIARKMIHFARKVFFCFLNSVIQFLIVVSGVVVLKHGLKCSNSPW